MSSPANPAVSGLKMRLLASIGMVAGGFAAPFTAMVARAADASDVPASVAMADALADGPGSVFGTVPPNGVRAGASGGERLMLRPSLNGTLSDENTVMTVAVLPNGEFAARAGDLRALRLKIDGKIGDDEMVHLSTLAGVTASYDAGGQSIAITAPNDLITPFQLGLGGARRRIEPGDIKPLTSLVLNYGLYNTLTGSNVSTSGQFEALLLTPVGIFDASTQAWINSPTIGTRFIRQDTNWRYFDDRHIRSYTVGDFSSNALNWTNSLRLAGLQISSAFKQRGDIVTTALPSFSATAALPSTVDLYINQQRIFTGEVPSGPYDLKQLPYTSSGNVQLVATDINGRQIQMQKPFYYVQDLLGQGLTEYSLDVGVPRLSYGQLSFDYDKVVFASGSVRHGVSNHLSLEAHAEGSSDGLALGGVGAILSLGGYGAISGSIAGSSYQGMSGGQYAARIEGSYLGVHAFVSTQRIFGDYFDLARVSSRRIALQNQALIGVSTPIISSQATISDQAGISFTPWFDKTSINVSYNRVVTASNEYQALNLSAGRSLGSRLGAFVNGFVGLNHGTGYGVFFNLTLHAGQTTHVSASYSDNSGSGSYAMQFQRSSSGTQGDYSINGQATHYDTGETDAMVTGTYYGRDAMVRGEVNSTGGQWHGEVNIEGSVVVAGGNAFLTNRVSDGFVIVKNAGGHADVRLGGQPMAQTNAAGNALLSNVPSYQWHDIYIDPTRMDDGWDLPTTQQSVAVGFRRGAVVDFRAARIQAAMLILLDAKGKLLAPGYQARTDSGETATIGYDGQVYFQALKPSNVVTVDLGAQGTCQVSFAHISGKDVQKIGPLTCQ